MRGLPIMSGYPSEAHHKCRCFGPFHNDPVFGVLPMTSKPTNKPDSSGVDSLFDSSETKPLSMLHVDMEPGR